MSPSLSKVPGSFRDPSGFLFVSEGTLYRQINSCYREHFELLVSSGLHQELVDAGMLVPHEKTDFSLAQSPEAYAIIRPRLLPFISYPYEWCFSQLRDAAHLTLQIQKKAFAKGMVLKDCSAYNVQFDRGKPIFIDTLSFEKYREGEPWVAYRQFCQHFLAPLALMALRDVRMNQLMRVHIDGVPLDLASRLLPWTSKLDFGLLSHIHLHAASQARYGGSGIAKSIHRMSRIGFQGIIDNLESAVRKLTLRLPKTEWGSYYSETNYSPQAREEKERLVSDWVKEVRPDMVWDLGANTGVFSRLAAAHAKRVISFDVDPVAVELNYRETGKETGSPVLPLLLDMTNPSPGIGWAHRERQSFADRGPADCILALAMVHHLAISNNVPLDRIAALLSSLGRALIIEWVPKNDSQVQRLLASRDDIFNGYTQTDFEKSFGEYFSIQRKETVGDSVRVLYLMTGISKL
jgi:hypothetical protein